MYNKQTDEVQTTRVNSLFGKIALLSKSSIKNKKGDLLQDHLFGSRVGLATAGSNQMKDDLEALLDIRLIIKF